MSDLFLSSQQQLTQALAQLNKVSGNSPLLKQGAEIIVKHLAGNQILLTDPKQNKSVTLSRQNLQGILKDGLGYKVNVTIENNKASLLFSQLSPKGNTTPAPNQLSPKQLSSILNLPSIRLESAQGSTEQLVYAKVVSVQGRQLNIITPKLAQNLAINVLDPKQLAMFKPGQQIQVQLVPVGKGWQAVLLNHSTNANTPAPRGGRTSEPPVIAKPNDPQLPKLLLESQVQATKQIHGEIKIPIEGLLKLISQQPNRFPSDLAVKLKQSDLAYVLLQSLKNGKVVLQIQANQLLAKLPLEPDQAKDLKSLNIPAYREAKQSTVENQNVRPSQETPSTQNAGKEIPVKRSQLNQGMVTQIVDLLRKIQPQVNSPSQAIRQIEQTLTNPSVPLTPESKLLVEKILQQINTGIPNGSPQDTSNIKQLLTSPPFTITPAQILSSASNPGLLNGLVTLLQLTLGARVARESPQLALRIAQLTSSLFPSLASQSPGQSTRTLQDFNQLDQRSQILRELNRLFSGHQSSKLTSAEQALQGQDSFYYVLPTGHGDNKRDIELLVKREQEKPESKNKHGEENSIWHLTMKLGIGEIGELLNKVKLQENQLDLDIYASNEETKILVLNFLPLLKKRFTFLGIDVAKSQCQLGKIPESLQNRPYHIFETQA